MSEVVRPADLAQDTDAIRRAWREIGWHDGEETDEAGFQTFLGRHHNLVAELNGSAEVHVASRPGTVRHGAVDLPMAAIAAVVCSRVARSRGLASRATARALSDRAEDGATCAALGVFDTGFYDRLGFGTGSYTQEWTIDPRQLRVPMPSQVPVRLGLDDVERMHRNRVRRWPVHGGVRFPHADHTRCEMQWTENGFGLGFADDDGQLTHHVWIAPKWEHGPHRVLWMVFEEPRQLLDLLGLLRSFGDQVHSITFFDPPGLQLQGLIDRPLAGFRSRDAGTLRSGTRSYAWWQLRILDVARTTAVLAARAPCRFVLELDDPAARWLDEAAAQGRWAGTQGAWTVTLDAESRAERGGTPGLPVLNATIGSWSRFWLGVSPARSLAVTDDAFEGPDELLEALDRAVQLPRPDVDWDF